MADVKAQSPHGNHKQLEVAAGQFRSGSRRDEAADGVGVPDSGSVLGPDTPAEVKFSGEREGYNSGADFRWRSLQGRGNGGWWGIKRKPCHWDRLSPHLRWRDPVGTGTQTQTLRKEGGSSWRNQESQNPPHLPT